MLRTIWSLLLLLLFTCFAKGQEYTALNPFLIQSDTLITIELEEIKVVGKRKNKRSVQRSQARQARLEYNVKKVYPYA
ncbi:MAG: DUF4294 domain-containing protein, partial [Odoribacter sp.]|nr:DUF4294 domain-containing protein [Odoribacter sp.]